MDFFEHQKSAKNKTIVLIALLIGAVTTLIAITIFTVGIFLYFFQSHSNSIQAYQTYHTSLSAHFHQLLQSDTLLWIVIGVISVVVIGSTYKLLQLSQGGKYVAESLGGRVISPNTHNANERKILNIVEEMAIASGNPVPPVYLLDDNSINAFAAGLSRRDAVIGVTQGCINLLNRDELQGVMAHEFSHIHNGDMRLNMRLIACLHGILVIGLIGSFIMRGSSRHSLSSHRNKNRGQQMIFGLALVGIGYGGTFFGNIIKAAVSRQREFLADASAVQFTRNPLGISGALKKIGGASQGSIMSHGNTAEFSHMLFGQGVHSQFTALMSTHPPLTERIRRIEPRWNGTYPIIENANTEDQTINSGNYRQTKTASSFSSYEGITSTNNLPPNPLSNSVITHIGEASEQGLHITQQLIHQLPEAIINAVHEPFSARAILYCLLIDSKDSIQQKQLAYLQKNATPESYRETNRLLAEVNQLERSYRLLLMDLSMPALKLLSPPQYTTFKTNLAELIKADKEVSLFEWCLYRIVVHTIEGKTYKETKTLKQCQHAIEVLLSAVVFCGKNGFPSKAFESGVNVLKLEKLTLLGGYSFRAMDEALNTLTQLKPLQKPILLRAIMACINADNKITYKEVELFRAIADTLNCPVPPIYSDFNL